MGCECSKYCQNSFFENQLETSSDNINESSNISGVNYQNFMFSEIIKELNLNNSNSNELEYSLEHSFREKKINEGFNNIEPNNLKIQKINNQYISSYKSNNRAKQISYNTSKIYQKIYSNSFNLEDNLDFEIPQYLLLKKNNNTIK